MSQINPFCCLFFTRWLYVDYWFSNVAGSLENSGQYIHPLLSDRRTEGMFAFFHHKLRQYLDSFFDCYHMSTSSLIIFCCWCQINWWISIVLHSTFRYFLPCSHFSSSILVLLISSIVQYWVLLDLDNK